MLRFYRSTRVSRKFRETCYPMIIRRFESNAAPSILKKFDSLPLLPEDSIQNLDVPESINFSSNTLESSEGYSHFITPASHSFGDLSNLGLCNWNPSGFCQAILELMHVSTGFPWWLTIAAASVLIRASLLPIFMEQARKGALMANISPALKKLQEEIKTARRNQDMDLLRQKTREMQLLFQNNNISPFSTLKFPLISGAVMMSFYFGIQGMCGLPVPSMQKGGFGPFMDLTSPDPFIVLLPLINAALIQINFKLGADTGMRNTAIAQNTRRIFTAFIWFMPFLTYKFQVAVFSYWIPTQIFAMFQALMLRNTSFRKRFRLPSLDTANSATMIRQGKTSLLKSFKGFFNSLKESAELRMQDEKRRNESRLKLKSSQIKNRQKIGNIKNIALKQKRRFGQNLQGKG